MNATIIAYLPVAVVDAAEEVENSTSCLYYLYYLYRLNQAFRHNVLYASWRQVWTTRRV